MVNKSLNKVFLLLSILIFSAVTTYAALAQSPTLDPEIINPPYQVEINVDGAIVRVLPDVTSNEVARLSRDTIVTAVARQGEWTKVESTEIDFNDGWILTFFLTSRPTVRSPDSSIKLIEPLNPQLSGKRKFTWKTDIELAPNQAFEMIFWEVGDDPIMNGFSPVGAGKEKTVSIDLQRAAESLTQLKINKDYYWGVLLVTTTPYQRLKFLETKHRFRMKGLIRVSLATQQGSATAVESKTATSAPNTSTSVSIPAATSVPAAILTLLPANTLTPTKSPVPVYTNTPVPISAGTLLPANTLTPPTPVPPTAPPPTPIGTPFPPIQPTSIPTAPTATATVMSQSEVRVHQGKQGYAAEQVRQAYKLEYIPPFVFGEGIQILYIHLVEMERQSDNGINLKGGRLIAGIPFKVNDDGSVDEIIFYVPRRSIILLQMGDQEGRHFDVSRYMPVPLTNNNGSAVVSAYRTPGGIWHFEIAGDFDMSRSRDLFFMAEVASQHLAREIGGTVMENSIGRALARTEHFGLWQRPDTDWPDGPWASQYMAAQCGKPMYYNANVTPAFINVTGAVSFDDLRSDDMFWESLRAFPPPPNMNAKYKRWYCENVNSSWQPPMVK